MNKLKENATLIKELLFVFLATVLVITSLTVYILSINVSEYGFDANLDYLTFLIIAIIFLVYTILVIVKKEMNEKFGKIFTLGLCSCIGGLYSIGIFFKKISSALVNKTEFIYTDNQLYLYVGIVCMILTAISIFQYFEYKNNLEAE